eukprot:SAG22_NODE_173_length_16589_cov_120.738933_12_plen_303_part_00
MPAAGRGRGLWWLGGCSASGNPVATQLPPATMLPPPPAAAAAAADKTAAAADKAAAAAAAAAAGLPVVDLGRWRSGGPAARRQFVTDLCAALAQHGFFFLVGHGIDEATRLAAQAAARSFFELPPETKRAVDSSLSPHVRGYSTLGRERTVGVMDVREVWEMGPDADRLAGDELAGLPPFMRLQGPNLWPAQPASFKPRVAGMFEAVGAVCAELLRAVAQGLGQPDGVSAGAELARPSPLSCEVPLVLVGEVAPFDLFLSFPPLAKCLLVLASRCADRRRRRRRRRSSCSTSRATSPTRRRP